MIEFIINFDESFFLWLNGFHTPFWDEIMVFFTKKYTWIPVYLASIAFIIFKKGWRNGGLTIVSILIAIGLANTLTSEIMKPFFERLRPCLDPRFEAIVHLPHTCGGKYSFASSHASNSFAFATMMFLFFRKEHKMLSITLFAWAAIVSYSRVYVGVHYPADIIVGAILGFGLAYLLFYITIRRLKLGI